jgi:hypothetical protein
VAPRLGAACGKKKEESAWAHVTDIAPIFDIQHMHSDRFGCWRVF